MNKANVFLLVVVSSLLTYISTATQPDSVSSTTEERWDYAVSHHQVLENGDLFFMFQVISEFGKTAIHSVRGDCVTGEITNVRAGENKGGGKPVPPSAVGLGHWYRTEVQLLLMLKLDEGWHPFQVQQAPSGRTSFGQYSNMDAENAMLARTYWRRRVQ